MNLIPMSQRISMAFIIGMMICFASCQERSRDVDTDNDAAPEAQEEITAQEAQLKELNQQIKDSPENSSLYNERARLHLELGQINQAFRDINRALEINGNHPDYLITLSDVYFVMGQFERTEQTLNAILIHDDEHVEAMLKLAQLYLYKEDHGKTFAFLSRALSLAPDDQRIFFLSGLTHKDLNDTSKALRDFHRTIQADQDHYDAWMQLGVIAAAQNDSSAIHFFNNALDISPESTEAYYSLGMFYQENEQYEKAIEVYYQLINANPNYPKAYYNLGYIHLNFTDDYEKAEQYFRKVLHLNPEDVNAVFNLGSSLEQQGNYQEARDKYQQTLEMEENYPLGIEGLNRLYDQGLVGR